MPVVHIDWAEGRTAEQKKVLIEYISDKIHEVCGVDKSRIIILINDYPLTNVGMNGEQRSSAAAPPSPDKKS
ncbi:MAG: 4-oxalocrotonate tautomerase family protein [Candidatus Adiutrix sp.]|jgi:4-oxalocrotonate tautomerase family enzyme|nr:4-oxalocrotonate tautomerase family protein [Candidatus Adiutrix sp.]